MGHLPLRHTKMCFPEAWNSVQKGLFPAHWTKPVEGMCTVGERQRKESNLQEKASLKMLAITLLSVCVLGSCVSSGGRLTLSLSLSLSPPPGDAAEAEWQVPEQGVEEEVRDAV